jgi:hypothetical protein
MQERLLEASDIDNLHPCRQGDVTILSFVVVPDLHNSCASCRIPIAVSYSIEVLEISSLVIRLIGKNCDDRLRRVGIIV